ncbi:Rho GTPase-activating 15 [Lecanosticta acicola]|uniref:Rho GTPase-activating 15 n=1 Tax=Lecanosticta acicola TaxID=111012 RepID=A0AAI8Z7H9_9PEZI|nr:Rho GTPase-activating 15 [Lecanosticta acicola]
MASLDSPNTYPESPMDQEDVVYPCKGCGDILEEGKAFELAGNRWHIDCFRCNTCGTLLDSDANLLLLGDGSLICNNCTYSCSACGNKIEDLAILTGDQAFCSGCFRCRNCKRKIENLRYARTSQGIFCMSCHESLMARRRKKARTPKPTPGSSAQPEKALPSLPPGAAPQSAFTPEGETPPEVFPDSHGTSLHQSRSPRDRQVGSRNRGSSNNFKRDVSPLSDDVRREGPTLPASTYNDSRPSNVSSSVDDDDGSERGFLPMAFDPTPISVPPQPGQQPSISRKQVQRAHDPSPPSQKENQLPRDYFSGANGRLGAKQETQRPAQAGSSRSVSTEREPDRQAKPSPHILYQEKGRKGKRETSGASTPANGSTTASPVVANNQDRGATKVKGLSLSTDSNTLEQQGGFKLQDAPTAAKQRSRANSKANSPRVVSSIDDHTKDVKAIRPISPVSIDSRNSDVNPFDDPKRKRAEAASASEIPIPPKHADRSLPLRGDSLNATASKSKTSTPDPATPTAASSSTHLQSQPSSHERTHSQSSIPSSFTDAHSTLSRDDSRSRPELHVTRSSVEPPPPRSANRPSAPSKSVANDDFIAPRHAPPPPPIGHRANESISTLQSNDEERPSIDGQISPPIRSAGLPKYSLDGGFSMDDEMGRILRGEHGQDKSAGPGSPSVLRRVSNAVKHGRSFSDRTGGKSPGIGSVDALSASQTPSITSPTSADGVETLRNSLRRAQVHIAELQQEKLSLQEKLEGSSEMKAVNSELREKRSTMAFLDTQREMVVRELEIMTEHLSKAKDNSQPLNIGSLKTSILKDFAESLQKLKDDISAQIEDLMHKRNELTDEIGNLIQMKDKGFQEYESLSSKNTQLLQHNNELLRSIQGMYQDNRNANGLPGPANGLGIYHPGAKLETSGPSEIRNLNIVNTDPSMPNVLHDPDADTGSVLAAPQVVNIRKTGKPNKFNWRRGGEKMAGKVTKGIKGAFVGNEVKPTGPYSIGHPYSQTQATAGSEQSSLTGKTLDDNKSGHSGTSGYGFFGQKSTGLKQSAGLGHLKNNSSSNLATPVEPSVLFGSELTARCEHENRLIPSVVTQCISEVEARGMDMEGIYRKSGGAGQVKSVQQGFEKDGNFDISDEDLDIHAVTSALKQYFRKLPTPLIVYDAYDSLLEAGRTQDKEKQVSALRHMLDELPEAHRDCLQFLVQHLARVMQHEPQNLMTSLNLAVVFAPTIMRPLSIEREMSDMQTQRHAVQALLDYQQEIFAIDD